VCVCLCVCVAGGGGGDLNRRWKRMLGEVPDSVVHEAVDSFWPVTNFVGLDSWQ